MSYMAEPNMQEAADKIAVVLNEHKLMGIVVMASQTRSGFVHQMSPPWSCVIADENKIHIRSKREAYPSLEAQEQCVSETIGGIMGMLGNAKHIFTTLQGLMMAISQTMEIKHVMFDQRLQRIDLDEGK